MNAEKLQKWIDKLTAKAEGYNPLSAHYKHYAARAALLQVSVATLNAANARIAELEHRLFPAQGEAYENEVERQRAVIDNLRVIVKVYQKRNAELKTEAAEQKRLFTVCHGAHLDSVIRARKAEMQIAAVRAAASATEYMVTGKPKTYDAYHEGRYNFADTVLALLDPSANNPTPEP